MPQEKNLLSSGHSYKYSREQKNPPFHKVEILFLILVRCWGHFHTAARCRFFFFGQQSGASWDFSTQQSGAGMSLLGGICISCCYTVRYLVTTCQCERKNTEPKPPTIPNAEMLRSHLDHSCREPIYATVSSALESYLNNLYWAHGNPKLCTLSICIFTFLKSLILYCVPLIPQ